MKYQIIASGSAGNLIYVECKDARVLIDAGITYKSAKERVNIDFSKIDAILVTHEHSDHVGHLITYLKKIGCPCFMNEESFNEMRRKQTQNDYTGCKVAYLEANKKYSINSLSFMPLYLSHDTLNCFGYIFYCDGKSLAYIADTGFVPLQYIEMLKCVDHIIIESNHDIEMLNNSDRPIYLKNRILSIKGHMSNITCGEVLDKVLDAKKCKCITLCHLSEECNTEEVAIDTVLSKIEGDYIPTIHVAKQSKALDMIEIE